MFKRESQESHPENDENSVINSVAPRMKLQRCVRTVFVKLPHLPSKGVNIFGS